VTTVSGGSVALIGALDTKASEYGFVRGRLANAGVPSLLIDVGTLGQPGIVPDIDRARIAEAGGADFASLARAGSRNDAMVAMASGAARLVRQAFDRGDVSAVLMLGGSNAAYVMSQVSAALPIGFPKLLVSTIAAGDTRPYIGSSDLTLMYPIVDIAGLNSITTVILSRATDACIGMVTGAALPAEHTASDVVGCSMFGVTTACVTSVRDSLVHDGAEAHVFHANGTGGRALEAMVRSGLFTAVADITTTELADELLGGVCSAGPDRLTAAAQSGVPQVVSVGALDMVNFGAPETVPERFAGRRLLAHNPAVTLMRTTPDECATLGRMMAEKLNESTAFTEVHVPARGFSQVSVSGEPFYDPEADRALIEALRAALSPRIPMHVYDAAINDQVFADEISSALFRALSIEKGKKE
jgi:uncharacterized protein (UPF0261 family)